MIVPLVEAIAALIGALTPLIAGWLIVSNWKTVSQAAGALGQTFGNDWIAPAVKPLVNATLFVFIATTGVIFGVYFLEKGIATRTGENVPLPSVPNPQAPPPPSFGASAGYGIQAGPVSVGVGQQSGHTAPPAPVPATQPLFGNRPFAPNMRRSGGGARGPRPRASFRANPRRRAA